MEKKYILNSCTGIDDVENEMINILINKHFWIEYWNCNPTLIDDVSAAAFHRQYVIDVENQWKYFIDFK